MSEVTYYDLSPSQKLLFMQNYINKQINNIFILLLAQKKFDLDMLSLAIETAYAHTDCLRLRITKINGKQKQYFAKPEKPEIKLLDFTGKSDAQMTKSLSRLARKPIKIHDRPMHRIFIVRSPGGMEGIYFGVNHMIMDAWAIHVFLTYILSIYQAIQSQGPLPKPLNPYEALLEKELDYMNTLRYKKDKEFWQNELERLPEPMYSSINGRSNLEKNRKRHRDPNLRYGNTLSNMLHTAARHEVMHITREDVERIAAFCQYKKISMQSVFMFALRHALSTLNERQDDITFMVSVARRAALSEKNTCGTRASAIRFRTVFDEDCTFEQACVEISEYQSKCYRHADFDLQELLSMESEHYHKKGMFSSYSPGLFTFEPAPLSLEDDTPMHSDWYCNGAVSTSFYLNIMDADGTGGLRCYYEYQYKNIKRERICLFHTIMMRSIAAGIQNPAITIGELLDMPDNQQEAVPDFCPGAEYSFL